MDWEQVSAELRKPLDAKHVRPPRKFGPKGDYIEAWHAQAEANRIFGEGAWCQEVVCKECVSQAERTIGQKQEKGWGVTYVATVRITVDGVTREDCGAGHGYDRDLGLAHESAIKEAVSDAMKRALKSFGNPFGLALYDKERANVADSAAIEAQAHEDAMAATKIDLMETCDTLEELAAMWKELPAAMKARGDVQDAKEVRKKALMPDNPVAA